MGKVNRWWPVFNQPSFIMKAMEKTSILPILKRIPLLEDLDEATHASIIPHIQLHYFPAQHPLFNEGDLGDKLYIIKMGMVKIFHPSDADRPIARLGPNDFFGEMALFRDAPRSASAMTLQESEIFILEKADFYDLVLKNPKMANKLSEEFLNRVQENENKGKA